MIDLISFNLLFFPLLILLILISIFGYGQLISRIIFPNHLDLDFKNLIFIKGLIFIGFISIFINISIPISDYISLLIIFLGSILYSYYFIKNLDKKKEIIFILIVLILSFFYSFYAGVSDDFHYHYETIKNFKNKNLFEILHHRMISYNSHWLFLTSIFSFNIFTSSLFILASLFFSITVYDLIDLLIRSNKNKDFYTSIISYFALIFFLGILSQIKDFGTDIPGVIISIYILLIIFYKNFDQNIKSSNKYFLTIFLLCQFAFIIKISNALIFLFLIYLFFKLKNVKINYYITLLIFLIPVPWIFQNFIISGCLIWPLSFSCFINTELAIRETYLIESFAKGDISTSMNVNNLNWIYIWFTNHFNKILETYILFIFILLIPFIYNIIKEKYKIGFLVNTIKKNYISIEYIILFIIILLNNLVWFAFAPAYRFGIFYNLSLIIIFMLPFWLFMIDYHFKFLLGYSKFILLIITIFFIIENTTRIDWYVKRYDIWPPINNGVLLDRKDF